MLRRRLTLKGCGIPTSIWARLFIVVALLEVFAIICIEGYVIKRTVDIYKNGTESQWGFGLQNDSNKMSITQESFIVYDVIFIVAQLFLLMLCWEAVAHKNTIQIIAATLFNVMCLVYSLIQYTTFYIHPSTSAGIFQKDNDMRILLITTMVVYSLCSVAFAVLTWELYQMFGWKTYKKLGANLALRRAYKWHQILLTLLKLDIFFFIAYSVQLATLVLRVSDPETWVQIGVVIPGSVVFLVLSFWALKVEKKRLMIVVIGCLGCSPAYFIYKLVRMNVGIDKNNDPYLDTRKYLTFFVVVTLALVLVTVYVSVQCYRNFGIGLKEAIADYDACKAQLKANRAMLNNTSGRNSMTESRYEYTDVHERFVLD
ncbi:hypothetical protein LPJ77_004325 [Coemansia sp. RSA 2523]|nr:hypothetical protein LPJ54_004047 [Coemansia sp. RSA 1824]KAJ1783302.1 hypothetical protein LPJ62_005095 [Coemansia sp. RSA 2167]KAJ1805264.1 hypothetical protein LPJ77_004325 [Coemansia sp. RSA 2523]KAJ2129135.1 hypothetical protein GGF48_002559 [Coemansia sp. RSA 921]KAJ2138781.1 hypothetical protein GGH17_000933 [Coemansia sp. RSA 788]KAJ2140629.1 hypothetical protein IW142_005308 [Coemansia sp. RSA 564]KAJ2152950.1 hypothetical protein J3F82_002330 [Coemansia sp. RSA 637]KAJ2167393.1 